MQANENNFGVFNTLTFEGCKTEAVLDNISRKQYYTPKHIIWYFHLILYFISVIAQVIIEMRAL